MSTMRQTISSILSFALLLLGISTLHASASPTSLRNVHRYSGDTTGKYIVKFKPEVSRAKWITQLGLNKSATVDWEFLNGISAELAGSSLETLRASDDVEYIAEDGIVTVDALVTQTDATWGLNRINRPGRLDSQDPSATTFNFTYDDSAAGEGVDIYILDTGLLITHDEFSGRAFWGNRTGGSPIPNDNSGHGTHCAGIAAGTRYGVAKRANVIGVQVFFPRIGSIELVLSGMQYVLENARRTGRPSVASMSFGGAASVALDDGVAQLTSEGIHVVTSAGNANTDAINQSPARSPLAITVGASDISDAKWPNSNWGEVVDVWAPGVDILSSWVGSDSATHITSGTSMAAPYVSGIVAYLISRDGNVTPAEMLAKVKGMAVEGVLSRIPPGTVNNLVQLQ